MSLVPVRLRARPPDDPADDGWAALNRTNNGRERRVSEQRILLFDVDLHAAERGHTVRPLDDAAVREQVRDAHVAAGLGWAEHGDHALDERTRGPVGQEPEE